MVRKKSGFKKEDQFGRGEKIDMIILYAWGLGSKRPTKTTDQDEYSPTKMIIN